MPPFEIAAAHQLRRDRIARLATVRGLRVWRRIDPQELDLGWAVHGRELTTVVAAAQVTAARQAVPYVNAVGREYGVNPPVRIVPEMFGGVMADGRELGPALFSAVTTTKTFTGRGLSGARAFEAGAGFLATLIGSAVHDLGRQADSVAAAGKRWTRYVRVLNPGACSRCAVLAGKNSNSTPFLRHPRCRCTAFPLPDEGEPPAGFFAGPDDYFESLSRSEQNRIFTNAGAEAIRNGANAQAVVNARRGASGIGYSGGRNVPVLPGAGNRLQRVTIGVKADGSPLQVFATTEGTTARGAFARAEGRATLSAARGGRYRRTTSIRLMPEQIAVMAGNDPVRYRELLVRYGYIG